MAGLEPLGTALLRVTLLGNGFGESVVLETPESVAIVDSAIGENGRPVALDFLEASGRSPDDVQLVAVTHYDLDHILGLNQVVQACQPARLVVPGVFRHRELLASLERERRARESEPLGRIPARATEILGAMTSAPVGALQFASEGTRCALWPSEIGEVTFDAWSPAAEVLDRVSHRVSELLAKAGEGVQVDVAKKVLHENDASVTLSIRAAGTHILLGADLEASTSETNGWQRAAEIGRSNFYAPPVDLLKIPHHGSAGAIDDALWSIVRADAIGMLAPWVRGSGLLPEAAGLSALAATGRPCWMTIDPTALEVGPAGGRMAAPHLCWIQASFDGAWSVVTGPDGRLIEVT